MEKVKDDHSTIFPKEVMVITDNYVKELVESHELPTYWKDMSFTGKREHAISAVYWV